MNLLPLAIEEIILNYKAHMEHFEKYKYVLESINKIIHHNSSKTFTEIYLEDRKFNYYLGKDGLLLATTNDYYNTLFSKTGVIYILG